MVNPSDTEASITFGPDSTQAPTQDLITFEDPLKQNLDERTATVRASKAHFALGEESPGIEAIRDQLYSGSEGHLRRQLAVQEDIKFRETKMEIIRDLTKNRSTPLTGEEMNYLMTLSQTELTSDPDTILEKKFANKYVDDFRNKPSDVLSSEDQNVVNEDLDVAASIIARKEYAQTLLEDLDSRQKNMGWGETIVTYGEQFIPFLSWANTSNAIKDQKFGGFLPGSNLREQVQYLYLLPPDQFKSALSQAVNDIAKSNILDAKTFAQAVISFSTSDEYLNNVFGLLDIADVATLGGSLALKGVKRGVQATSGAARASGTRAAATAASEAPSEVAKAVKDAVKGLEGAEPDLNKILTHQGKIDEAGTYTALTRLKEDFTRVDPNHRVAELKSKVASIFNPDVLGDSIGTLSRESADRILLHARESAAALREAMLVPTVGRLTDQALTVGLEGAKATIKREFNHFNDSILDIDYVSRQPSMASTYEINVKVAKPDQTLFENRNQAYFFAKEQYKLLDSDYRIEQQGTGFYINITRTLDETQDAVRDVMVDTANSTPTGLANSLAGWVRTADDLIDPFSRGQRKAVQSLANEMHRYGKSVGESIGTLRKESRNKLNRLWEADRRYVDPATGKIGRFAKTLGEFEKNFRTVNNAAPTEAEAKAYFDAVALNDFDWFIRNYGVYRDKARTGVKEYTYSFETVDPKSGDISTTDIPRFEGKIVEKLPDYSSTDPFTVLVYDPTSKSHKFLKSTTLTDGDKQLLDGLTGENGFKAIEVYQVLMNRPFKKVTGSDEPVNFVLLKDYQESRLSWDQLPYQPGGHKVTASKFYVKQPVMSTGMDQRKVYMGDKAVFGFETQAEAAKYAQRMEEARKIMLNGGDLKGYLSRNLPFSDKQFRQFFEETVDPATGERIPPTFLKTERFVNVSSGRKTVDDYRDIAFEQDATRSPYGNYPLFDKEFTTSRDPDLWTVKELGSELNPVYKLDTARTLDPLVTLNRSMRNIMTDRAMNDYRISSIEKFATEFQDVMTVSRDEFLRSPMEYLENLPLDAKNSNKDKLAAAKNSARAIKSFIGTNTELGKQIRWAQEKAQNLVYNNLGQTSSDFVSENLLGSIPDPARFMRSVAFHTKLGLFNPVQLFVQGQGLAHAMAIAGPVNGTVGAAAGGLFSIARLNKNPQILDRLGSIYATLTRSSKKEFIESWQEMRKTGWDNVEGEVAFKDDVTDPKVFTSGFGQFLDKGTIFFKETERLLRQSAWHMAYREFRKENPDKMIGNLERMRILERADLLTLNMTRASNASWQQGLFSVPTQFFAFQARLAEQMLGKRLTQAEKRRAILMYSTLYGVPVGAGTVTAVYPWYQEVREQAIARGVNVDDTWVQAFHNGMLSVILEGVTGTEYNVAERLGPGGISIVKELIDGDKTLNDFVFGASGSILGDIIGSLDPLVGHLSDLFNGTNNYEGLLVEDFMNASKEISSLNSAFRVYMAAKTGEYISKKGTYIGDTTTFDSLVAAITGLTPVEMSDAFVKGNILKDMSEDKKELTKKITNDVRRGLRAAKDQDFDLMESYFRRSSAMIEAGGFTPQERSQLMNNALSGQSVMEVINRDWFRKGPQQARDSMMQQLMNMGN